MVDSADEDIAQDASDHCALRAERIIERQRTNIAKGSRSTYDSYLKGWLQFCVEQGHTSIHHNDALFRTAQQPKFTAEHLNQLQIRPCACAQFLNQYKASLILSPVSKARQLETDIVDPPHTHRRL